MADELAEFYKEVLKLISHLCFENKITEDQKSELKKLIMEDEEFVAQLKEEYDIEGLNGLENIIVGDSVSNSSFRDLMDFNQEKRKRSQSLTIQTDSSE
ncbi:unnamed protein product (macronuclear) [Paramecium tetraurelia]|uniref:ENT domain-containing protein n=1 Tax=Paramecium tetraurelia TaxID=5888 RepID=A0CDU9_PARTE|nr:uncharacterized protein GSPATT00007178001 [Paramecium tetraurelia]CAK68966.1 unnamed protein product [Paramecium tetraurelia]|eukprot:XP_001436363.1 hypothetical protein (macronuclear) [Paramecium tetraurelia strain d4-2]